VKREPFANTIGRASTYIGASATSDIWESVALRDDEVWASDSIAACRLKLVEPCGINAALLAQPLNKILQSVKADDLTLTQDGDHVLLKAGRVKGKLLSLPLSDYPDLKWADATDEGGAKANNSLWAALRLCIWDGVTANDTVMSSVCLRQQGRISVAMATDGYRLVRVRMKQSLPAENFLIPARAIAGARLEALDGVPSKLVFRSEEEGGDSNRMYVVSENGSQVSLPITVEGFSAYPTDACEKVLDTMKAKLPDLATIELPEALPERLGTFATVGGWHVKEEKPVTMKFGDGIALYVSNELVGELSEDIEMEGTAALKDVSVSIPATQLKELLKFSRRLCFDPASPDQLYFTGEDKEVGIGYELLVATGSAD